jgi:hypothetical protein
MDERNIERQHALSKESGYLRKKYRDVVTVSAIDRIAHIASDEERVHMKALGVLRIGIRRRAFRVKMYDLDIAELARATHKRIEKDMRSGRDTMDKYTITRLDG